MNSSEKSIFDDIINESWEELKRSLLYWAPNMSEEKMAQAKNNFYATIFLAYLEYQSLLAGKKD